MVLGEDEDDEFSPTGEKGEEDDEDLGWYDCPGEVNDVLAEKARIISLEKESEKEISDNVENDVILNGDENIDRVSESETSEINECETVETESSEMNESLKESETVETETSEIN